MHGRYAERELVEGVGRAHVTLCAPVVELPRNCHGYCIGNPLAHVYGPIIALHDAHVLVTLRKCGQASLRGLDVPQQSRKLAPSDEDIMLKISQVSVPLEQFLQFWRAVHSASVVDSVSRVFIMT